ncbi:MAG: AMP-binding protein [Bordetella sp.]|nr:AMP-binding protein [Bordetella sp.]
MRLSRDDLRAEVARAARALQRMGVKPGDRVAAYLPNVPEAMIGMLGCASIGAVRSICATDLAAEAVVDRFAQIERPCCCCPTARAMAAACTTRGPRA